MMIRKMTSATTVLLVGGTSLMLSSTTMADTVQFYFNPYGLYPGEEAAENWDACELSARGGGGSASTTRAPNPDGPSREMLSEVDGRTGASSPRRGLRVDA